jgi:hypothetical protein
MHTYEPQWRQLELATRFLQPVDTRSMIAVRVPALAEWPALRLHFDLIRPQDPMHDFDEGVCKWYLQQLFASLQWGMADIAAFRVGLSTLATAVRQLHSTLDLPTSLKDEELTGGKLTLTGTHIREGTLNR